MRKNYTLPFFCAVLLLAMGSAACKKIEGPQKVPAYIHIDSISVDCDYYTFGANSHNITDAWVYIDDQILGCFELPATFPVLKQGQHKVTVYPGICSDGRGAARGPYPFYKPKVYENLNLVMDSIVNLNPVVNYYPVGEGVMVGWMEDFETGSSMVPASDSDTNMMRVSGSEAWHSVNSYYSGKIVLPPDSLDFTVIMADPLTCHTNLQGEKPVFLEMDYKTNDTIFVGIEYYQNYQAIRWPMVKVLPSDTEHDVPQKWKKIYINLGTLLHEHESASYFKVYFTSDLSVNAAYEQPDYVHPHKWRYYYFDNLKVLYRQ